MAPPADARKLRTVEADPSGRYIRCDEVLSRGASLVAYKGQDRETGAPVAWNQLPASAPLDAGEREAFDAQVRALTGLSHPNVLDLRACWIDDGQQTMNFVTEYFNPGPLRRHRKSRKRLSLKTMRDWTWQILQGLVFLHEQNPPMIHRDLKCDTVFIHGTTGDVKIANLGLASLMGSRISSCHSVVGSPEFMAPELLNGDKHDAKVDVYAFGMLLLELATQEFPYRECKNTGELMDCFEHGRLPEALFKVHDLDARDLIEMCISHDPQERPESRHLMGHPFFDALQGHTESSLNTVGASLTQYSSTGEGRQELSESCSSDNVSEDDDTDSLNNREYTSNDSDIPSHSFHRVSRTKFGSVDVSRDVMSCELSTMEGTELGFELCVMRTGNMHKRVKFTYDVATDNVEDVVDRLEEEYELLPEEKEQFRRLLYEEVGKAAVSLDMSSNHPSMNSSIFTDGKTRLSEIWAREDDEGDGGRAVTRDMNKTTMSTFTDLQSLRNAQMTVPNSPTSKDFWNIHKGHDVNLGIGGEEKNGRKGHVEMGSVETRSEWNNYEVVTMGPKHGSPIHGSKSNESNGLERASVDSKDRRGFCDAFLPKWVTEYGSLMDGAAAAVRGLFGVGAGAQHSGMPKASVVVS
eukprot:evm.model.scf_51.18 EVM.evm.TU.scf_51.18   scf_51:169165-175183(-)